MRDSGASCSFINSKLVKKEDYTGENALVTLAEGSSQIRPLAKVEVETPFFKGKLTCIVSTDAKQDLLIGNYNGNKNDKIRGCKFEKIYDDREKKKVYETRIKNENNQKEKIEVIVTQEENIDDRIIEVVNSEDIEQKIQDVIIEKVTEREQYNKNIHLENKNERDVEINKDEINMVTTRSMELTDRNKKETQAKIIQGIECKPEELIKLQQNDDSLKNIRNKITEENTNVEGGSYYFISKGIIFRKTQREKRIQGQTM